MGNKKSSANDSTSDSSSEDEQSDSFDDLYLDELVENDEELQNLMERISGIDIQRHSTFNPMIVHNEVSSETMNYEKPNKVLLCFQRWKKFSRMKIKHVSRFCFKFQYDELMNQRDHDFIHIMMLIEMKNHNKRIKTHSSTIQRILPYEVADIIVNHVGRYWFFHKYFGLNVLTNINAFKSMNVSYIFADYHWSTKVLDQIMIFNQGEERKRKSDIPSKHNDSMTLSNRLFQYILLLIPPTIYAEYEGGEIRVYGYRIEKQKEMWTWCLFHKSKQYEVSKIKWGYMVIFKFDVCIVGNDRYGHYGY